MNPDQGAGIGAALLYAVKDLPLWLLVALAAALDIFLLTPELNSDLPRDNRWWVVLLALTFSALAVARAFALGIQTTKVWRARKEAKQRFHLTPSRPQCHWSISKQADDSFITQFSAGFSAKNRSATTVTLLTARLVKPHLPGELIHATVFVRSTRGDVYRSGEHDPDHSIPPGAMLPAVVHLMVRGKLDRDPSKELLATIAVGDEEGNEQFAVVTLRGTQGPRSHKPSQPTEPAYNIPDPVEKKVVSVLQSELSRYQVCGRSVGGFGSVHIEYGGRSLTGFGNDSWTPDSPNNQSIVRDTKNVVIKSDNADALLALYSGLSDDSQHRLVQALLNRLDQTKGYLRVSYFIVFVLWKLGYLQDALKAAKERLPQGEMREFGLSNVLFMLNGLLRYRHSDFTDDMLDRIEHFVDGMTEHTFLIREKLSAIRSLRLQGLSTDAEWKR